MMEKLGAPQTHLGLKAMIKEVDEDLDDALVFREFLLIFRWENSKSVVGTKAIPGSCVPDSLLEDLTTTVSKASSSPQHKSLTRLDQSEPLIKANPHPIRALDQGQSSTNKSP